MFKQKIAGQPCENGCGGNNVLNPKTGKIFCENKCWLKGTQAPQTQNTQNVPQPPVQPIQFAMTASQPPVAPTNKTNEIRANVALKMCSELIASGHMPFEQWENWANRFYFYEPTKSVAIPADNEISDIMEDFGI